MVWSLSLAMCVNLFYLVACTIFSEFIPVRHNSDYSIKLFSAAATPTIDDTGSHTGATIIRDRSSAMRDAVRPARSVEPILLNLSLGPGDYS